MCYDTLTLCNAVNINPKLVMYTDSVLYINYTERGGKKNSHQLVAPSIPTGGAVMRATWSGRSSLTS